MATCVSCDFFKSFRDDYFDDMEPEDQGFCKNGKSKYFGNEGAGFDHTCDFHSLKNTESNIPKGYGTEYFTGIY